MRVSKFDSYSSATPTETISIFDWLRNNRYQKEIETIRAEEDKNKRDILKAKLPAITPSGTFSYRSENSLIKHSGFMQFDLDKLTVKEIMEYKQMIAEMPYTFYCGLSVSGRGLWGLFQISQPYYHKSHFRAMQKYFKSFGIKKNIDPSPSNVSSLRGSSYDRNAYLNENAEIFEWILEEPKKPKKTFSTNISTSDSVADDLNENGGKIIEALLLENGWGYHSKNAKGNILFTRPGKTSGPSADYDGRNLYIYSNSEETGFEEILKNVKTGSRALNNWAIYVHLECKGNQTEAARKLYDLGFGNKNPFPSILATENSQTPVIQDDKNNKTYTCSIEITEKYTKYIFDFPSQ